MANATDPSNPFVLRFTPAEWHRLLEDRSFLDDPCNGHGTRRRLLGLPVEIIADHEFAWRAAGGRAGT